MLILLIVATCVHRTRALRSPDCGVRRNAYTIVIMQPERPFIQYISFFSLNQASDHSHSRHQSSHSSSSWSISLFSASMSAARGCRRPPIAPMKLPRWELPPRVCPSAGARFPRHNRPTEEKRMMNMSYVTMGC